MRPWNNGNGHGASIPGHPSAVTKKPVSDRKCFAIRKSFKLASMRGLFYPCTVLEYSQVFIWFPKVIVVNHLMTMNVLGQLN